MPMLIKMPGGLPAVVLTGEDMKKLAVLADAASQLEALRQLARDRGIIAEKLEDLRIESSGGFVEVADGCRHYRSAVARHEEEVAYFCPGCGCWVVGNPNGERYREGCDVGVRYLCRICYREVSRAPMMDV